MKVGKYHINEKISYKKPIFCKARPVKYALRSAVNGDLQRLQDEYIIKWVTNSKWETSVVPVVKPNSEIRLCDEFKATLNKCLKVEKYSLPNVEVMLATIGCGQSVSKFIWIVEE